MHVELMRVRNFRRLADVRIDLERDISIFVGANNSGKTSASQAVQLFMSASAERFSVHDFNVDSWKRMNAFGDEAQGVTPPTISLDVWFHVEAADLARVIDLLPSLAWEGTQVGVRIEFAAHDEAALLASFQSARENARAHIKPGINGGAAYHPQPRTLFDYLADNDSEPLRRAYALRYFVLDRAKFDANFQQLADYSPLRLSPDEGRSGKDVLHSLLRVDFLHAQRHLSDAALSSRAEDLSRCLSRFYDRNLEKLGQDHEAIRALSESEAMLSDHLQRVFEPTLARLGRLGYPGLANPRLLIKSALNPASIMSGHGGARVHYELGAAQDGGAPPTLPDRYNGLGFKNLIYMVVELLDLHAQWMDVVEGRPALHLIFIEEPEAHLHAQLQQVFIREVLNILTIDAADRQHYSNQLIVTTHSPHILYERGFRPIRYFRRPAVATAHLSEVLNLSTFYAATANPTRDFLERYLKLTHCDLFFADAAVLVEGNVERLLLPQMIATEAPRLQSAYVTILEIGGAFGHRFRSLVEFLGITALVITDIDSVAPAAAGTSGPADAATLGDDDDTTKAGSTCMVHVEGAQTSNQMLIQWLPKLRRITELLAATAEQRTQPRQAHGQALIRVTYQNEVDVVWQGATTRLTGRTLEEAFALENLAWCQDEARAELNLRIPNGAHLDATQLSAKLHTRIHRSGFGKTDFALALLAQDPSGWRVPRYIAEGLTWLADEIVPAAAAAFAQQAVGGAA